MKKHIFGKQFKRDSNERKALFKSLIRALILRDSIKTTREKAKAISGAVDKIVTLAKRGSNSENLLGPLLPKEAISKLVLEITPRFAKRHGGYTRIIKIGRRLSDNAQMVLMEWTDSEIKNEKVPAKGEARLGRQNLEPEQKVIGKPARKNKEISKKSAGKPVGKPKAKRKEVKK